MKLTDSILERYRRWRHRRGYGVHSPYAYTLIREALFPPRGYAYYADEDPRIEPLKGDSLRGSSNADGGNRGSGNGGSGGKLPMKPEILLRLALHLAKEDIRSACYLGGKIPSCYSFALQAAGLRLETPSRRKTLGGLSDSAKALKTPIKSVLIIVNPGEIIPAGTLEEGCALLLLNPGKETLSDMFERMERLGYGLLLYSHRYLIAIPRPEMAFTSYCL